MTIESPPLASSHGFDPAAECFHFVLRHLFDEGVECSSAPSCDHRRACGKARALQRFCERKFAAEEALLRQRGDPALAAHVEDHRRFLGTLGSLPAAGGCSDTLRQLKTRIEIWTTGHFAAYDRIAACGHEEASPGGRDPARLPASRP